MRHNQKLASGESVVSEPMFLVKTCRYFRPRDRDRRRETGDGKRETGDGTHKRETADGTGDWRQEKADRIQKTGDDSLTSYPENLIKRMNFTIF